MYFTVTIYDHPVNTLQGLKSLVNIKFTSWKWNQKKEYWADTSGLYRIYEIIEKERRKI